MAEGISRRTAQQIVDTVKDVCGKNINFINEKGIITASTDPERVDSFHEVGKKAILTGTTIEVDGSQAFYGTQKGVNIPILHNGSVVAAIGISGEPDEVRKYAYLARKIAVLLLRERDLNLQKNHRKNQLNYMIRSLTGKESMNHEYFQRFLKEYALSEEQEFYTLLIRLKPETYVDNLPLIEQQIFRAFESCGSGLYTFCYPNEYVQFLKKEDRKEKWKVFEQLAKEYGDVLKAGLGSLQPLSRQYLSYRAAELALRSLDEGRSAAVYEELDFELILRSVSDTARDLFLQKTVEKLAEEDLQLLQVYFEEEQSLLKTSMRLNLHKNTLQYRLDRIHRLCGYNPRVFREAVVLYSAVKLKK